MPEPILPAVSVSIITYNQRELIGRAIDSVLMQEVDFTYEIVIGDDCSDDGTQEVVREYQRRHPNKIQLILHPRRYTGEIPGRTNNTTNLLNCRGKYTAMLDGDDYWTDPYKLQRQYDRMEAHPELSMCLHDAHIHFKTEPDHPDYIRLMSQHLPTSAPTGLYTHEDLAMRRVLSPFVGSVIYRTANLRDLPEWFYEIVAADYALFLHLSRNGPVYYDAEPAAAYYISAKGFQQQFRKNPAIMLQELKDIDTYANHFPAFRLNGKLTRGKSVLHWHLYQHYRDRRERRQARYHLLRMFRHDVVFGLSMVFNPIRKLRRYLSDLRFRYWIRSAENSAAIRS